MSDKWRDYEDMIIYAVRYCIGRRTYAVDTTCKYYSARIKKWSNHCLVVTIRDIDRAYSLGDDRIDKPEWLKLRGLIYQELLLRYVGDDLELLNKYDIPARCPHD